MRIAVVVPVLNEEAALPACLAALCGAADEIVVVDGGSTDRSRGVARAAGARVIEAPRGRASQMNAGAAAVQAQGLVFVHADTRLPAEWRAAVERAVSSGARWGRFDVRLDSDAPLLAVVGAAMNARSRLTGICTGDQAIFVTDDAWRSSGGFPAIPLMEDVELSRRLKRVAGAPACLRERVTVSARRWERGGPLRTIVLMWTLRALHFAGVPAGTLHRLYYGRRAVPR